MQPWLCAAGEAVVAGPCSPHSDTGGEDPTMLVKGPLGLQCACVATSLWGHQGRKPEAGVLVGRLPELSVALRAPCVEAWGQVFRLDGLAVSFPK